MRLYHGTASTYLPSIESVGLIPSTDNTFRIETEDGKGNPYTEHAVYLTTNLDTAKAFAEPDAPAAIPDAKPIVLVLDVPESIAKSLHPDDAAPGKFEAFWYPGVVPPSTIKNIYTAA